MIKCKNCVHRNDKGNCTHPKIAEDTGQFSETERQDALIYSYSEGGGFWVGPFSRQFSWPTSQMDVRRVEILGMVFRVVLPSRGFSTTFAVVVDYYLGFKISPNSLRLFNTPIWVRTRNLRFRRSLCAVLNWCLCWKNPGFLAVWQ